MRILVAVWVLSLAVAGCGADTVVLPGTGGAGGVGGGTVTPPTGGGGGSPEECGGCTPPPNCGEPADPCSCGCTDGEVFGERICLDGCLAVSSCGDGYADPATECCDPADPDAAGFCDDACCCWLDDCFMSFTGTVSNVTNPLQPGPGVTVPWTYGGEVGIVAGHSLCNAIGGDHVCTFEEAEAAIANGEITAAELGEGTTFWLHREPAVTASNCNDFLATGPAVDGEFGEVINGAIVLHADADPTTTDPSLPCFVPRSILCCFPSCGPYCGPQE